MVGEMIETEYLNLTGVINFLQPEVLVLAFAILFLLLEGLKARGKIVSFVYPVSSFLLFLFTITIPASYPFGFSELTVDSITQVGKIFIVFTYFLVSLFIFAYGRKRKQFSLFVALTYLSLFGCILMFEVGNLISFLIAFEIASLPAYGLAGFFGKATEQEAAVKYFSLGAVSSAVFVLGSGIIAALAGGFNFGEIGLALTAQTGVLLNLLLFGLFLVIAAFSYKVALFPWQLWSPDVYQGQETLSLIFIGTVPKIGGFLALYRLFENIPPYSGAQNIVLVISVLTIFVANISGIVQHNLARIIAFSSISHAGFIFLAFLGPPSEFLEVLLAYLFVYTISNIGVLSVMLGLKEKTGPDIGSISGLYKTSPIAGFVLAISIFSLAGIPPFPGFFAKLFLFTSIINDGYIITAIFGVLMTAIALGYYLPVVREAVFSEGKRYFASNTLAFLGYSVLTILIVGFVFYMNAILQLFGT